MKIGMSVMRQKEVAMQRSWLISDPESFRDTSHLLIEISEQMSRISRINPNVGLT